MKFFVLKKSGLQIKEIRLFRTKVIGSAVLLSVMATLAAAGVNYFFGDPLGLGMDKMSVVIRENRVLKEQLKELSTKLHTVQNSLTTITERGNELRLMVDLKKLDDDTRQMAVGGSVPVPEFSSVSGEATRILSQARGLLNQLTREIKLQQSSYEEIYKRYEHNKGMFAHIPAIKPMEGYYTINGFGMRVHPVLGVYRMHEGVDIINDVGTAVYATGDGVVRFSGRTQGGYGTVVDIVHGYGYSTLYSHLSRVNVKPGQRVRRGELIGLSGRSGLVSGPHLHYEVRLNGRKQNPVDYFFDDVNAARYRTQLASRR